MLDNVRTERILAGQIIFDQLSYTVARRTNEIGVRIALGAQPHDALWMILKDALVMACLGFVFGIPLALWGKRIAASLIEGLPMQIVVPILIGIFVMVVVALLAAYLPARRASRVDPIVALRYE